MGDDLGRKQYDCLSQETCGFENLKLIMNEVSTFLSFSSCIQIKSFKNACIRQILKKEQQDST